MSLFSKTGVVIATLIFAVWIIAPLILIIVSHLLGSPGQNIGLVIGFLKMVSIAGLVFAAAYAAAAYFGKPWLLASPVLIVVVTSVVGHFRPTPPLQWTTHAPYDESPATALAHQPGVTLESLLHFSTATMSPASAAAVAQVANTRQRELASHIREDRGFRNHALYAAPLLTEPGPEILAAVQSQGQVLCADLRRFNERNQASDCQFLGHLHRDRFLAWRTAWVALHRKAGLEGTAPVQEILELARVRSDECPALRELQRAAEATLQTLSQIASR